MALSSGQLTLQRTCRRRIAPRITEGIAAGGNAFAYSIWREVLTIWVAETHMREVAHEEIRPYSPLTIRYLLNWLSIIGQMSTFWPVTTVSLIDCLESARTDTAARICAFHFNPEPGQE